MLHKKLIPTFICGKGHPISIKFMNIFVRSFGVSKFRNICNIFRVIQKICLLRSQFGEYLEYKKMASFKFERKARKSININSFPLKVSSTQFRQFRWL